MRHNPVIEQIAASRAADATYWRVTYEPWSTVGDDSNVRAAGIGGLPALIVFEDGREIARLVGYDDAAATERTMFPQSE